MARDKCSKCGLIAETYPVNFDRCKELCLDCRWQLVHIHNQIVDLNLPSDIKHIIFTRFFASRDGYSNLIKELKDYSEENTKK